MTDQPNSRLPSGAKTTPDPLSQDEVILRQALTHSTPSATYVARLDTTASNLFVSPEIDRLLDLKPNESISDPNFWYNHLHPEDRDFVMSEIARQQQSERPIRLHYRMLTGTGKILTIRDEAFIIRNAQGQPLFLQGILYDITSLPETETALTETFDRLHFLENIIEKSPTLVFRWRLDDAETVEFVTANVSLLGYSASALMEGLVHWPSLIHPPDLPRRTQERNEFLHAGIDEFILHYRLISHSGELHWVEDRSRVIRDQQGHPTHIEGLLVDITQRKIIEQNLAFQNAFRSVVAALRSAPEEATEGEIWQAFLQALVEAFGFALAWYGPVQAGRLAPQYWAGPGESYIEGLTIDPRGKLSIPSDCPILEVLRTSLPHAHCPSTASTCPFHNAALHNGLQATLALPCLTSDHRLEGVLVLYSTEAQAFPPDALSRFQDLALEIGETLRERRHKQEAALSLRQSESRYRFLIDHITDILWSCDTNLLILDISPSIERFQGFSRAELIGRPLSLILPPGQETIIHLRLKEELASLSQGVEAYEDTSQRTIELPILHKDGHQLWAEITYFLKFDDSGQVTHLFGVSRDITARKNAQLKLQDSEEQYRLLTRRLQTIREEESTRISRVIHDDLGQCLSVLKMDTVRLQRRIGTTQPDLQNITTAMLEMIERALFTTQRIAMDLHPGILDDLGLAPAIEWYVQQMQPHTEVRLSQIVEPPELVVPPAITLPLFRILQEAVTNTLRHAQATTLTIHLTGDEAGYHLLIEDDGKGIPSNRLTSPSAFGLIQIRERDQALAGQVDIESPPGGGTRIRVQIPRPSLDRKGIVP